jgi:hypothetical protein
MMQVDKKINYLVKQNAWGCIFKRPLIFNILFKL